LTVSRVLVVDDEPALRELMRAALEPHHEVADASDATAALELWRTYRPDVVLLDVMLPGASGIDILRQVRSDETFPPAKVIVVSAWDAISDRERVDEHDVDAFISKPFLPDELLETVDRLVREGNA
jgi:CheY-like chemotaxis protein